MLKGGSGPKTNCCTPLHACVYNVHTSITTAVLPYMHVCTMYIAVLPYMHMYRFLVVIGYVGGGSCYDSGVWCVVCDSWIPSWTTRQ